MNRTKSHVHAFIDGSLCGTISTVLLQPFDVLKTRLQTQEMHGQRSSGMLRTAHALLSVEGPRALWRGTVPSLWRCVPGVGLYFGSLSVLQGEIISRGRYPSPLESGCMGLIARCFAVSVLMPCTVVKVQYESGIYKHKSVPQAMRSIYQKSGVKGLWRGLYSTLLRDGPYSGLYLFFYNSAKRVVFDDPFQARGLIGLISCAMFAACASSLVTQPADVIKTRRQIYPERSIGFRSLVGDIYRTNGFSGFFRGIVPRILRRTAMSALSWTLFENLSVRKMAGVGK